MEVSSAIPPGPIVLTSPTTAIASISNLALIGNLPTCIVLRAGEFVAKTAKNKNFETQSKLFYNTFCTTKSIEYFTLFIHFVYLSEIVDVIQK